MEKVKALILRIGGHQFLESAVIINDFLSGSQARNSSRSAERSVGQFPRSSRLHDFGSGKSDSLR